MSLQAGFERRSRAGPGRARPDPARAARAQRLRRLSRGHQGRRDRPAWQPRADLRRGAAGHRRAAGRRGQPGAGGCVSRRDADQGRVAGRAAPGWRRRCATPRARRGRPAGTGTPVVACAGAYDGMVDAPHLSLAAALPAAAAGARVVVHCGGTLGPKRGTTAGRRAGRARRAAARPSPCSRPCRALRCRACARRSSATAIDQDASTTNSTRFAARFTRRFRPLQILPLDRKSNIFTLLFAVLLVWCCCPKGSVESNIRRVVAGWPRFDITPALTLSARAANAVRSGGGSSCLMDCRSYGE